MPQEQLRLTELCVHVETRSYRQTYT